MSTDQSFFGAGPTADPLPYADLVQIRAFDRDGNVIGSLDLVGRARLAEPIDLSGLYGATITLAGEQLRPGGDR